MVILHQKTLKDQLGRSVSISPPIKRIISLVPSQTELLFDLGLEGCIVGITKFCVHPPSLKKSKIIVGGTKNVNLKKIEALKPDIILCNKEENTKEIVKSCEKIAPVHVSNIQTIHDTLLLINQYAHLFHCHTKANEITKEIHFKLSAFKDFVRNKGIKKCVYFIWKSPWMVAANNTFINHLLKVNKLDNVYRCKKRYPEITLTELSLKDNVELLFLSSEPYPFKEKHAIEIKKSFPTAKVILVDGEMFSWYGSRLLKAFDYFRALHRQI
ncbi:conserved hypothetical protein [Tenacibaculum maritimum]|nr:conserved hypothetical protein [Tenacibaculum maritimum]CAA0153505.1 conserved hypothetical protein [Tenacibaculum maritimum]CAA0177836.1 conserved hypothetical protein [Tenacibaculum maritimum]CAA0191219.1 conserved hypothetical protein [Tenacibaculum maritimum]CAA0193036.1 conserved hypothetical protein [Tenacibaculum maritimum]